MASPPSASDVAQTLEEAHLDGLPTSKGSRGGAKGGKGKAKSKEGGPRAQNRDVLVSKALSKLLRHDAEKVGLKLDGEGFARCDEVVSFILFFC
jgi:2'-phosphotransferase